MNISKLSCSLLAVAILPNLTACGYIKSLFPDKEKDYQYTTEIPPLILPPDLGQKVFKKPQGSAAPVAETPESPVKAGAIAAELVKLADGQTGLRLGVTADQAWPLVEQALAVKTIAITKRAQKDGSFNVNYQLAEEDSIWDGMLSVFGGGSGQALVLKLLGNGKQTDVVVLNGKKEPVKNDSALTLLKSLQDALQAGLTK